MMAERVVRQLETGDIDEEDTQRAALLLDRACSYAERLAEVAPVRQPGQRVGARLLLEPDAKIGVVERHGDEIGEGTGKRVLGLGERDVVTLAPDYQNIVEAPGCDQRDGDRSFGHAGCSGNANRPG